MAKKSNVHVVRQPGGTQWNVKQGGEKIISLTMKVSTPDILRAPQRLSPAHAMNKG